MLKYSVLDLHGIKNINVGETFFCGCNFWRLVQNDMESFRQHSKEVNFFFYIMAVKKY